MLTLQTNDDPCMVFYTPAHDNITIIITTGDVSYEESLYHLVHHLYNQVCHPMTDNTTLACERFLQRSPA